MDRFKKILHKSINTLSGLGAIVLAIVMLIIFANIIVRIFGKVVPGSFETIELIVVITIAFSMAYTGMHKGHVSVDIILKRFPVRIQNIINTFNYFVCMVFWGAMGVFAFVIAFQKGWMEITDYFRLSYFPVRIVFGVGLLLLSLTFFIRMCLALKESFKR